MTDTTTQSSAFLPIPGRALLVCVGHIAEVFLPLTGKKSKAPLYHRHFYQYLNWAKLHLKRLSDLPNGDNRGRTALCRIQFINAQNSCEKCCSSNVNNLLFVPINNQ